MSSVIRLSPIKMSPNKKSTPSKSDNQNVDKYKAVFLLKLAFDKVTK